MIISGDLFQTSYCTRLNICKAVWKVSLQTSRTIRSSICFPKMVLVLKWTFLRAVLEPLSFNISFFIYMFFNIIAINPPKIQLVSEFFSKVIQQRYLILLCKNKAQKFTSSGLLCCSALNSNNNKIWRGLTFCCILLHLDQYLFLHT